METFALLLILPYRKAPSVGFADTSPKRGRRSRFTRNARFVILSKAKDLNHLIITKETLRLRSE
jgi:hypothetical protein